MASYAFILIAVLIISPFAISLAEKQDKKTKVRLKYVLLLLLLAQIILGLFNWESLFGQGRSGWQLAVSFPTTLLWLFFAISTLQFLLLLQSLFPAPSLVVFLNFLNTAVFFLAQIRLSRELTFQAVSLASITAALIVLFGNVIGLLLINKEKRLRLTPLTHRKRLYLTLTLALVVATILYLSYWNSRGRQTALSRVSNLPEVKEYLSRVKNGVVVIDHEDRGTDSYIIHVYEVVGDHTATFNWYEVGKTTGEITTEF